jgi:F0F1-type ATP synthase membrane subunit c/vacuolar-type H+-ATPase subunit K
MTTLYEFRWYWAYYAAGFVTGLGGAVAGILIGNSP